MFLGFKLTRNGYRLTTARVEAIMKLKPHRNLRTVRGFLGVINFIKNHIHNRAEILTPITELTRTSSLPGGRDNSERWS